MTRIGGLFQGQQATSKDGTRIRVGTQVTTRNLILTGFGGEALDVRDDSPGFFMDGTRSVGNAIIHHNGGLMGAAQIRGGVEASIGFAEVGPKLVNVRYEANPDPRPMMGFHALGAGVDVTPPSDGVLDPSAPCIGAFCNGENWLEEWTLFDDEIDCDFE